MLPHRSLRPEQKQLLRLFLLCIPLILLGAAILTSRNDLHHSDFFAFWLAGKMNWLQMDPYNPAQWTAGHDQFGATWKSNDIFAYPLPLALLLAPFGLLTIEQAYFIWITLAGLVLVGTVIVFLGVFLNSQRKIHLIFPLLAAVTLFRPTLVTIYEGQLGAFLLLILSLASILLQRGRFWLSAVVLSCLMLKPPIGAPILFLLVLWLIFQKNYKTVGILFAAGVGWLLVGLLQDRQWIPKFLTNGGEIFSNNAGLFSTTWGLSSRLCNEQALCSVGLGALLTVLLLGISLWVLWSKKNLSALNAVSLIISVSLVITPYIWPYDQILLIVPILYLTMRLFQRGAPYLLVALFPMAMTLLSLGLLLLAIHLKQDTWSVLLPLICFGLSLAFPQEHGTGLPEETGFEVQSNSI